MNSHSIGEQSVFLKEDSKIILITNDSNHPIQNYIHHPDYKLHFINHLPSSIDEWPANPDVIIIDCINIYNWNYISQELQNDSTFNRVPVILLVKNITSIPETVKYIEQGIHSCIFEHQIDTAETQITAAIQSGIKLKTAELKSNELNRYLSTNYLVLDAKNELLENIKNKLEANSSQDTIDTICKNIKINLKQEYHYQLFKVHFEEVHPLFFKNLLNINTSLTENNLKLISFLKMGFNNTEISFLLNTSMAAVKKSIQRIKPKLGLSPKDSLRSFVFSIKS